MSRKNELGSREGVFRTRATGFLSCVTIFTAGEKTAAYFFVVSEKKNGACCSHAVGIACKGLSTRSRSGQFRLFLLISRVKIRKITFFGRNHASER